MTREPRTDLSKLNIVLVKLLLHDLLEHLERQLVSFDKGHLLAHVSSIHDTGVAES